MTRLFSVHDGHACIPLMTGCEMIEPEFSVRLVDEACTGFAGTVGIWEFESLSRPEELHIDFTCLDLWAVQVRTPDGMILARRFEVLDDKVPGRILAVLRSSVSGSIAFAGLIELSGAERASANCSIQRSQLMPIEWFFIELTNRCNFRCLWCPERNMTRTKGMMSLDKAKWLLDEIAEYRKKNPSFSLYAETRNPIFLHVMGEPLLYPSLFDVLAHGHKLGLTFCLITNASLMDETVAIRLIESGLQSIVFSLNVADQSAFSSTGASLSYSSLVDKIQNFIRKRYQRHSALPRIEIQLLTAKHKASHNCSLIGSERQIQDQLAFWLRFVRSQEAQSENTGWTTPPEAVTRWPVVLDVPANAPESYFSLGKSIFLVFKSACSFGNAIRSASQSVHEAVRGSCPFRNPYRVLCVMWNGSCTFCSLDYNDEVDIGNVFELGIDNVWAGERMQRIRRQMTLGILSETLCRRCMGTLINKAVA